MDLYMTSYHLIGMIAMVVRLGRDEMVRRSHGSRADALQSFAKMSEKR